MGRSVMARKLMDFFLDQGKVLSLAELNSAEHAPVRGKHVRKAWGTYRRCLNAMQRRFPGEWEKLDGSTLEESAAHSTRVFGEDPSPVPGVSFKPKQPETTEGLDDE